MENVNLFWESGAKNSKHITLKLNLARTVTADAHILI
jgi:hypothetical protein